jgi:hypothetical protein
MKSAIFTRVFISFNVQVFAFKSSFFFIPKQLLTKMHEMISLDFIHGLGNILH